MMRAVTTVIILLLAGAVLLVLETVLPGMIAGIIGFLCLVAGVVTAYVELGSRPGNITLLVTLFGLMLGWVAYLKYFPDSRAAQKFISQRTIGNVDAEQTTLLNLTGKALTNLRPSGMALIDGRRVDVVTEGTMINAGTEVKVVAIEGLRTVVRAV